MRRKICVVTLFLVFIGQIVMAGGEYGRFQIWEMAFEIYSFYG